LLQQQQQHKETKVFEAKYRELEEKIAGTGMSELFPEFRPNQVCGYFATEWRQCCDCRSSLAT